MASWFETRQRVRAKRYPMINSDALLTMRVWHRPHPDDDPRPHPEEQRLGGVSKDEATGTPSSAFSLAFTFGCDLFKIESQIAKVNRRTPGKAPWIGFSTSLSLVAALTAAASRAMRR